MGSSGSGSFSDYSKAPASKAGNGGQAGGSSGSDKCGEAFAAGLEDVASYQYYGSTGGVPPLNTPLHLELQTRVVAVTSNGVAVGALPTRYNYLAACLKAGYTYTGSVRATSKSPNPQVDVDFVVA